MCASHNFIHSGGLWAMKDCEEAAADEATSYAWVAYVRCEGNRRVRGCFDLTEVRSRGDSSLGLRPAGHAAAAVTGHKARVQ